ncbi:MAG: helix-turn-helix domain-containing protein [Armatimonadetes bacterium]|nr:helix-turn-helix domain-containing protein [Armatimonadota bacterium]
MQISMDDWFKKLESQFIDENNPKPKEEAKTAVAEPIEEPIVQEPAPRRIVRPRQETQRVAIDLPPFFDYVPLLKEERGETSASTAVPVKPRKKRSKPTKTAPSPKTADSLLPKLAEKIDKIGDQYDDATTQRYYRRPFEESREMLLARIADQVLSLKEVARILGVCPMSVRRYTDKGWLPHFRTEGNQRRFRLSDVAAFLENETSKARRRRKPKNPTD